MNSEQLEKMINPAVASLKGAEPVRLCLSRTEAENLALAWAVKNNVPPDSRSAVMLFIYHTFPKA